MRRRQQDDKDSRSHAARQAVREAGGGRQRLRTCARVILFVCARGCQGCARACTWDSIGWCVRAGGRASGRADVRTCVAEPLHHLVSKTNQDGALPQAQAPIHPYQRAPAPSIHSLALNRHKVRHPGPPMVLMPAPAPRAGHKHTQSLTQKLSLTSTFSPCLLHTTRTGTRAHGQTHTHTHTYLLIQRPIVGPTAPLLPRRPSPRLPAGHISSRLALAM